jgi:hypothetical protein
VSVQITNNLTYAEATGLTSSTSGTLLLHVAAAATVQGLFADMMTSDGTNSAGVWSNGTKYYGLGTGDDYSTPDGPEGTAAPEGVSPFKWNYLCVTRNSTAIRVYRFSDSGTFLAIEDDLSSGGSSAYTKLRVGAGRSFVSGRHSAVGYYSHIRYFPGVVLSEAQMTSERTSATPVYTQTSGSVYDWPLTDNTDPYTDTISGVSLDWLVEGGGSPSISTSSEVPSYITAGSSGAVSKLALLGVG